MEEKNLSEKDSLELISQMISNSRQKLEDGNGIPFLIWGYTTFFVSLVVFYFINVTGDYHYHYLWFLIPAIGSIGMFISERKKTKYSGHGMNFIERVIGNIWTVIGIAAFIISVGAFFVRIPILSLVILLMGIGTALTGLVIKFKPVTISGFIGMASCVVPFVMKSNEQILVFGVIYLIMMVVPGHILNYKGRKKHV
ncbi:MAG: hypothetical protein P4L34_02700 [Paludibacter sp.]|nr:hypothetical protein [Paludibacter sp.]